MPGNNILIDGTAAKQHYFSSVPSTGFTYIIQGTAYKANPSTGSFTVKIRLTTHVINNTITFYAVTNTSLGTYMYALGTKR